MVRGFETEMPERENYPALYAILNCQIIRFFRVPGFISFCKSFRVFKFSKDIQHLLKWTIYNALESLVNNP